MISLNVSLCIARFPTREEATAFTNRQAPFIELFTIEDATKLHPELKDPMAFSVLYRLKNRYAPRKPYYSLDQYGNMVPESL